MASTNPALSRNTLTCPTFRTAIYLIVSAFLQLFHRGNDQALGVFDLLHDEADIHRGKLRLPLAPAIDAMLADERERVRQDIQRCCQAAANGAHLKVVPFFGLTIVIEQVPSRLQTVFVESFRDVDERFQTKADPAGLI